MVEPHRRWLKWRTDLISSIHVGWVSPNLMFSQFSLNNGNANSSILSPLLLCAEVEIIQMSLIAWVSANPAYVQYRWFVLVYQLFRRKKPDPEFPSPNYVFKIRGTRSNNRYTRIKFARDLTNLPMEIVCCEQQLLLEMRNSLVIFASTSWPCQPKCVRTTQ